MHLAQTRNVSPVLPAQTLSRFIIQNLAYRDTINNFTKKIKSFFEIFVLTAQKSFYIIIVQFTHTL